MATTEHLHLDGTDADHVQWSVDVRDDDFDAAELERAMLEARQSAYRSLADLGAA